MSIKPKNLVKPNRLIGRAQRRDPYRSKLELEYSVRLSRLQQAGLISEWRYEPCNIRLANNTFYKVDWLVIHTDRSREWCETKGYHQNIRESLTKWKVAAGLWPWDRWTFVTKVKGRLEVSVYYPEDREFLQALHASLPPQSLIGLPPVVWQSS